MKLSLRKRLAEKLVCAFVKKAIKKAFGIKIKFDFADGTEPFIITDENGITHIYAAIEAEVKESDIEKIIDEYDN